MTSLSIRFGGEGLPANDSAGKNLQSPRIFSGEPLSGTLAVSGNGTVDAKFDTVELVFEGNFIAYPITSPTE